MDIVTFAKLVTTILAMIGIWKVFYEFKTGRKAYFRAEYEFSKKFLNDIKKGDVHPFSLEKGYQAIAGNATVTSNEVEYLLTLENPSQCLKDYVLSRHLMEKIDTTGNLKLNFKVKYESNWSRQWRKKMYFTLYVFFASIALSPLFIESYFNTTLANMAIQLMITMPVGVFFAWSALDAFVKISRGEHLILNQRKHTQRVIIGT